MNKINIAELLKDCPKGMKLDCTMYEDVYFDYVDELNMIHCYIQHETYRTSLTFNQHGTPNSNTKSKCVIFPKGKTTWEGFVPPCKFKDGDVIFTHANCLKVGLGNTWISIFQEKRNGGVATYVDMREDGEDYYDYIGSKGLLCMDKDIMRQRFATEEEKAKLFQAIKDNGYKWNAETKTLEKLVEPRFKVGDKIKHKEKTRWVCTIRRVEDIYYVDGHPMCYTLPFGKQDEYELLPNKFDVTTLKPFDKVLVRETNEDRWLIDFYAFYNEIQEFSCVKGMYEQCIPYEGNEHLFLSFDDCDEYFKTWE